MWRALAASRFCFNRLYGAPDTPPDPLPSSARPGAEATLPVDAVGSAAKPLEADAMAGPDRGGLQNDLNSPRGLQFKIMIGSAGPNCSYTYYILRRLNTTRAPLKTSHQA